jgi:hypothetical protein
MGNVARPPASSDELTVLAVLLGSDRPLDGADIAATAGRGLAAVYPPLIGLEQRGWIRSQWDSAVRPDGPRRRTYRPDVEQLAAAHVQVAPIRPAPVQAPRRRPWYLPGWA